MTRVMVDTNVVVSALLSRAGPTQIVLDAVLTGAVRLLADERILEEYQAVLTRSKFRFGALVGARMAGRLRLLAEQVRADPCGVTLPDEADAAFIEVARSGRADWLVTGNLRHFPSDALAPAVAISPADAAERLRQAGVL